MKYKKTVCICLASYAVDSKPTFSHYDHHMLVGRLRAKTGSFALKKYRDWSPFHYELGKKKEKIINFRENTNDFLTHYVRIIS